VSRQQSIDVAIIGGGASGLMVAAALKYRSAILYEHNATIGAKIAVSGGGRCNLANQIVTSGHFRGERHFVETVLRGFDQADWLDWLQGHGLRPVIKKSTQYFCPHSAKELIDVLRRAVGHQSVRLRQKVQSVERSGEGFMLETSQGAVWAQSVVVATGGLSYPILGGNDTGYRIAAHFGHDVVRTAPALVGFTVQKAQHFFKRLSGSTVEVIIQIGQERCEGPLLFAHKGISGPAVLDASLYWERGVIEIDFLPKWSVTKHLHSERLVSTILPLPKRVAKAFLEHLEIPDVPLCGLDPKYIERLLRLKHYTFAPAGTFGYTKAEVTRGGVATDEIDPYTMMSRRVPGLYFVGEVLDVTGRLGGYNFQWAFSSAVACARALEQREALGSFLSH
jgi:predicted Rossmann fold flavoprotein